MNLPGSHIWQRRPTFENGNKTLAFNVNYSSIFFTIPVVWRDVWDQVNVPVTQDVARPTRPPQSYGALADTCRTPAMTLGLEFGDASAGSAYTALLCHVLD